MSIDQQIADFLNHNELQGRVVRLSPAIFDQLARRIQKRGRLGRSRIVRDPSLAERGLDLYVEPTAEP